MDESILNLNILKKKINKKNYIGENRYKYIYKYRYKYFSEFFSIDIRFDLYQIFSNS